MRPLRFSRALFRRSALGWAALSCCVVNAVAQVGPSTALTPPTRTSPPITVPPPEFGLRVISPPARQPIEIARASLRTEIVGQAARTQVEIVFKNPNAQVLEGELQFPLAEGQSVSSFALDINGEMRPAVPVEKAKGQQVFEDTIRQRVDPALLERTQGNNFKLRIYPLPAHGERRVSIELVETLPVRHGQALYRVPLQWAQRVGQVELDVRVADVTARQVRLGRGLMTANVRPLTGGGAGAQVVWSGQDVTARQPMELNVAVGRQPYAATQSFDGETFFYAEVPVPEGYHAAPSAAARPVARPQRLGLVWDASGSAARRDLPRELALLDTLFTTWAKQGEAPLQVELVVARDVATPPQTFTIHRGDWRALRQALEALAYDGATATHALAPVPGCDVNVLFSDGLPNYGATVATPTSAAASAAVVHAVQSSVSANTAWLRQRAEASGGQLLDLTRTGPTDAAQALTQASGRVMGWQGAGLRDVVIASRRPDAGRVLIAGVLTEAQTTLTLSFETATGQMRQVNVPLRSDARGALAASRWANLTLDAWEADADAHRGDILRLGQRFGLATSQTSLIVLDSVADYVRHEIAPPASLRNEYQRLLAQKGAEQKNIEQRHLAQLVERFQARVAWYDKDHRAEAARRAAERARLAAERPQAAREQAVPIPRPLTMAPPPPPAPAPMPAAAMAAPRPAAPRADAAPGAGTPPALQATTTLAAWQPSEEFSRRMQAADAEQAYAIYLQERPSRSQSTAFFLESAEALFAKKADALALRILSNLAEVAFDQRAVLRILAYRLEQAGRLDLALPILQRVRQLAPNEPQSWRDVGLALAKQGRTQAAIDALWHVVSRPWDGRFRDVDLTTLAELNAVIARAPASPALNLSAIDPRLLKNLPLGLRVVLRWDADNTDMDLHVLEPSGEEAMFAHALTEQGGKMSADVTGGYGPEEYALRHPLPGVYRVRAKFFGHRQQTVANTTTVQAQVSTQFGTPQQQDQLLTLRLNGAGQMVDIGSVSVDAPTQKP